MSSGTLRPKRKPSGVASNSSAQYSLAGELVEREVAADGREGLGVFGQAILLELRLRELAPREVAILAVDASRASRRISTSWCRSRSPARRGPGAWGRGGRLVAATRRPRRRTLGTATWRCSVGGPPGRCMRPVQCASPRAVGNRRSAQATGRNSRSTTIHRPGTSTPGGSVATRPGREDLPQARRRITRRSARPDGGHRWFVACL